MWRRTHAHTHTPSLTVAYTPTNSQPQRLNSSHADVCAIYVLRLKVGNINFKQKLTNCHTQRRRDARLNQYTHATGAIYFMRFVLKIKWPAPLSLSSLPTPASAPSACLFPLPLLSLLAPFKARFDPILFVANNFIRRSCASLQLHLLLWQLLSCGKCHNSSNVCNIWHKQSQAASTNACRMLTRTHTHLQLATNCNTSAYTLATHLPHTHVA